MGDISIIGRRRKDNLIQYGWSGNGGYFRNIGYKLLAWYDDPEMVDYLFGLGQISNLGKPLSEKLLDQSQFFRTCPTGREHWQSDTERSIFSKIAFVDYGYFYDKDSRWYYIQPGPIRIKIPLELIYNHLDDRGYEFDYLRVIQQKVTDHILNIYPQTDQEFAAFLGGYNMDEVRKMLDGSEYPIYELYKHYIGLLKYFDDWAVIVPDAKCDEITGVLVRKAEKLHLETIDWPGHPVLPTKPYRNPSIFSYAKSFVVRELKELVQAYDGHGDNDTLDPVWTVPEWFICEFRKVMGNDKEMLRLLDENLDRLLKESKVFESALERGLEEGEKIYRRTIRERNF